MLKVANKVLVKILNCLLTVSMFFIAIACGAKKSHLSLENDVKSARVNLIADQRALWKNGQTINVLFLNGTPRNQKEIERLASIWTQYALVDFKFYTHSSLLPKNLKPEIIIDVQENTNYLKSASYVGKFSLKHTKDFRPSMFLNLNRESYYLRRSHILHEFGHALGLRHEHAHPLRTFQFNDLEVKKNCEQTSGVTVEACFLDYLKKEDQGDKNLIITEYDHNSIMHYEFHSNETLEKVVLKANYSLSLLDKINIAKLYPGRMSREDIEKVHRELQDELEAFFSYEKLELKKCDLSKVNFDELRIGGEGRPAMKNVTFIGLKSKKPGNYWALPIEDKEAIMDEIQNGYCSDVTKI